MKNTRLAAAVVAAALVFVGGRARAGDALDLPVHEARLENGLRVFVTPSPTATAVAVVLSFRVGSRNETPGLSGFAHLFEHMMFQGSANVPKGEHFRVVSGVGGDLNAYTTYDMTQYYEVVPPGYLPLALWLESDRLGALALTEETLRNQVDTVREELRQRVENATYVPAMLRLEELLFGNWRNAHPVIGGHEDIDRATVADARAFFERYYTPANGVLVISGAVEVEEAVALARHYFGRLPATPAPEAPDTSEPTPGGPRVERQEDAHARTPALLVGWQGPARNDPDFHAVSLLADILGGGESSRLHQRLVKRDELVAGVSVSQDGRLGPDALEVTAVLTGDGLAATRAALAEEVARLRTEPVPADELGKVQNQAEASFLFGLRTALGRAQMLARLIHVYGEPTSLGAELARYRAVTPDDIRRVAERYLVPATETVVEVVPAPAAEGGE